MDCYQGSAAAVDYAGAGNSLTDSGSWLDSVTVTGPEADVAAGQSLAALFGLPPNWLAGDPEFKLAE